MCSQSIPGLADGDYITIMDNSDLTLAKQASRILHLRLYSKSFSCWFSLSFLVLPKFLPLYGTPSQAQLFLEDVLSTLVHPDKTRKGQIYRGENQPPTLFGLWNLHGGLSIHLMCGAGTRVLFIMVIHFLLCLQFKAASFFALAGALVMLWLSVKSSLRSAIV